MVGGILRGTVFVASVCLFVFLVLDAIQGKQIDR